MEINDASKVLAYSFVSELIRKKKTQQPGSTDSLTESFENDSADINFSEIENYYKNVVSLIENTPDIRKAIVSTLKEMREKGDDLNSIYSAKLVAEEKSLNRMVFPGSEE